MRYYTLYDDGTIKRSTANPHEGALELEAPPESMQYPMWDGSQWVESLNKKREAASMPADELEMKLDDMGLLDDVESLTRGNKKWEIRWRRNSTFHRNDPDLIAGAKRLWPDTWEANLDQLFGVK